MTSGGQWRDRKKFLLPSLPQQSQPPSPRKTGIHASIDGIHTLGTISPRIIDAFGSCSLFLPILVACFLLPLLLYNPPISSPCFSWAVDCGIEDKRPGSASFLLPFPSIFASYFTCMTSLFVLCYTLHHLHPPPAFGPVPRSCMISLPVELIPVFVVFGFYAPQLATVISFDMVHRSWVAEENRPIIIG